MCRAAGAACVAACLALSAIPARSATPPTYVGPLVCADASCPTPSPGGPVVNNSDFHLRDISIDLAGDGYFYLTGTSSQAGDAYWSDVWGVIRMWRSRTLLPGSVEPGGRVVYNVSRDCSWCSDEPRGCRTPNTPEACPAQNCSRVWAPEFHFLPAKATEPSGGYYLTFHFHCAGGGSGVLQSTTGEAFGPYADLLHGVSGGDVTLFTDPADGAVYTASSGSSISAARLSANLSSIVDTFELSGVCSADCSHTNIGFEGTQLVALGGAYFLCASAYGNETAHGGPRWPAIAEETAASNIYYSTYCGRADSIRGPFLDVSGDPGGWLSVPFGGHNTYFSGAAAASGRLFSTLWYGSSARDLPPQLVALVDLPSVVEVQLVGGRLVAAVNSSVAAPHAMQAQAVLPL